jgi:hypothetical protein
VVLFFFIEFWGNRYGVVDPGRVDCNSSGLAIVWSWECIQVSFRLFCLFFFFLKKKNCRYISLPDYASHGFNTNVGHLLSDGDIMKLDADLLELGTLIGKGGQGGRNMRN